MKSNNKLKLSYSFFCNSTKYVDLYFNDNKLKYMVRYRVRKDKSNSTFISAPPLLIDLQDQRLTVSNLSEEQIFQLSLLYPFDFDIIDKVQKFVNSTDFFHVTEDSLFAVLIKDKKYNVELN